jgi:signal peptidase I
LLRISDVAILLNACIIRRDMANNFNQNKPPNQYDPIPKVDDVDRQSHQSPNHSNWRSTYKGFFSIAQLFAGALLLAFFINHFIFQSYEVFGQSMYPTLNQGDRLIISKVSKSWNSLLNNDYYPSRGEIIVFHNPRSQQTQLIKRVVGVPGDRVVVSEGKVTVFNEENPDGFMPDDLIGVDLAEGTEGNVDLTVNPGEVFVVGDNRLPNASFDSRSPELGTIPVEYVVGELVLRVFPLGEAGFY